MKDYRRDYPLFSLCGLHCGLCPIHHMANGCPGCGGGEGHQPCAVIRCSREHGGMEYCFQCGEFPCGRFTDMMEFDSFVPTRNVLRDLEKARTVGMAAYRRELDGKAALLERLLERYNDGRRKSFFCTAVNLLELEELRETAALLDSETERLEPKERGALAAARFQELAKRKGVELKLRKKPKKK